MDTIFFLGYELLTAFVPFAAAFWGIVRWQEKAGHCISGRSRMMVLAFLLYMAGVLHFTGAGTLCDGWTYRWEIRWDQLNYIPFSNEIDGVAYFLNVLLFVPLGIFVPLLWERLNSVRAAAGVGLAVSLIVESSQLLNNRRSDVDDLILNTLGAILGFFLYAIWDRCTKSRYQRRDVPVFVLLMGILLPLAGRFFLFDRMGLARWLYGF